MDRLGGALREHQQRIEVNPYAPNPTEVKLGLASRQWRLLRYLVEVPTTWTGGRSVLLRRALVDTHILAAWLLTKNDDKLYDKFVEFGRGKLKLLKLQIESSIDAGDLAGDISSYLSYLEGRVGEDIVEEFQPISLGANFAGVTTRSMAIEAGLKQLYDLVYQPLSAETHAEWNSLIENDLVRSSDPLHRGHRFGAFDASERLELGVVLEAFTFATDTIQQLFASMVVDVAASIDTCADEFNEAIEHALGD